MAFDPKIVFGLCNVLNRHSEYLDLPIEKYKSKNSFIEQVAKKLDLVFRDNRVKWDYIFRNPDTIMENLLSIESLYKELVFKLYSIDDGIQKQLSRKIVNSGFPDFRKDLREGLEVFKFSTNEVKKIVARGSKLTACIEALAAVEAVIEVWLGPSTLKKVPKKIHKNNELSLFITDVFEVFEIKQEASESYRKWYLLTQ